MPGRKLIAMARSIGLALATSLLLAAPPAEADQPAEEDQSGELISDINSRVNREMIYCPDRGGDEWRVDAGCGDCEDFALRKLGLLAENGVYGVVGVYWHKKLNRSHAVAVVRGRVLDSLTDEIRSAAGINWTFKAHVAWGKVWLLTAGSEPVEPQAVRKVRSLPSD